MASLSADGRFAPSPSGTLHIGSLRTALLAWCFARSHGGRFRLRIDDLDRQRSQARHERAQIADLRALGIDWDGEPLRQSQRSGAYGAALERLRAAGRVYECWCTRAELRLAAQAPHGSLPEGAYPGTCRRLSASARAARRRAGQPTSLRLDARGERIGFKDLLQGPVEAVVDDFVLWRADGTAAYNLATVVDDAAQEIGEVVRGDDLLETTPRQILLAHLLGVAQPRYAHVALVLGPDGRRLAKRHGAVTLGEWPGSIGTAIGWMAASAGLAQPGEELSARAVLARFDPDRLRREPAVLAP